MRWYALILLAACTKSADTDTNTETDTDTDTDSDTDTDDTDDTDSVSDDRDEDGTPNAEDCGPDDATRRPGATELCNLVDENCDQRYTDIESTYFYDTFRDDVKTGTATN